MTDLKKIATAFDLTVTKFASLIGYTKQGLYQASQNINGVYSGRMCAALNLLNFTSDSMYEQDIAEARIKKNQREKAIKELAYSCGLSWQNNITVIRTVGKEVSQENK